MTAGTGCWNRGHRWSIVAQLHVYCAITSLNFNLNGCQPWTRTMALGGRLSSICCVRICDSLSDGILTVAYA